MRTDSMDHDPSIAGHLPRRGGRRRVLEGAVILVFWSVIACLAVMQAAFDPRFDPRGGARALPPGEVLYTFLEYGLWILATPVIFWLASRFSFERPAWSHHLAVHLLAAILVTATVDLAGHALWNAVGPGHPRPVTIGAVFEGFHFVSELILYLVVLAAGFAREYALRYRERLREAAQLRAERAELEAQSAELQARSAALQAQLAEARLQALRRQLNPHFLFNTLNTISSYLERDPRGVRRMIARLSELLRYALDQTDAREVPLRQELYFIDRYLEIQRIRFEDRLEVRHDVDPAVMEALVPNLILQPLVENAIKHGFDPQQDGGRVEVRAWREGDDLHLSVHDDGPGLGPAVGDGASSGGIGLRNTRERLESLYGPDQHFALEPAEGGGLVAHVRLPYHTGTDLYTTAVSTS